MPSATPSALRRATRVADLLTVLALAGASGLPAATITVNSASDAAVLMDDGLCTLREAIGAANHNVPSPTGDCPGGEPAPVQDVTELAIPGGAVVDSRGGGRRPGSRGSPGVITGTATNLDTGSTVDVNGPTSR